MKGSVYERQTQQILTGGWNALLPSDLLSNSDALQCQNFRVNTAGNLRSRFGSSAAISSSDAVQALCQVKGEFYSRYTATYAGPLLRNGVVIGDFGPGNIGMVSYQGFLWAMSHTLQKKDNGFDFLDWSPAAPADPVVASLPAASGSLTVGKIYTYWITYAAFGGQESPSNPAGVDSAVVVAPDQSVTITSPAPSADAQVIGWNVYRSGDTLEDTLRLNRAPIPIGTDFIDTGAPGDLLDDYSVTQLGLALDPDSSGPPAGDGLAGPYYDRLLAWGVVAHPNRLFWSGQLQPYNFPGSNLDEGNHVDIGELGEGIVGVTIRPRTAIVYKDSSIWRMVGDPGDIDGGLELVTKEMGAIGRQAIISVGSTDYFQTRGGVYSFNGDRPSKVTAKLDPLFWGEFLDDVGFPHGKLPQLDLGDEPQGKNCLGHKDGRLYFFYCSDGSPTPNCGVTSEVGVANWGMDTRPITAILDEGGGSGRLLGAIGGDVVPIEKEYNDSGAPIPVAYHSGYKNQDAPDNQKTYVDIVIEHNTGGASLTVSALYNNGVGPIPPQLASCFEAIGSLTSSVRTTSTFQCNYAGDKLGVQGYNIAIGIDGDTALDHPASIYKILLHYFIEPRDSKTFDSDETDLGDTRVKALYELEFDIDAAGAATWELFTNVAAGVVGPMAQADTGELAATVGRQAVRIPLAAGIEGRLARVTLRSDLSSFRLHGCRIRVLPYGEWIDSVSGETFDTVAINVGNQ